MGLLQEFLVTVVFSYSFNLNVQWGVVNTSDQFKYGDSIQNLLVL